MAFTFDGTDDSVHWGDLIDSETALTVSAWVYNDNVAQDHCVLSNRNAGAVGILWWTDDTAFTSGRTDTYSLIVHDGTNFMQLEGATGAASASAWQHLLFSFAANSATGLELWIDGTEDANSPGDVTSVNHTGSTGANWTAGERPTGQFDRLGDLAEMAVWTRVLLDDEKVTLSKGYSPAFFGNSLLWYAKGIRTPNDVAGGVTGTLVNNTTYAPHPPKIIYPAPPFLSYPVAAPAADAMPMAAHLYRQQRQWAHMGG